MHWLLLLFLFHEDDPKILDRQPPVVSPSFRAIEQRGAPPFTSLNVTLASWLPLAEFGANHTSGADCWGYTSPSGREYALIGLSHGTGFVEISNPDNAQVIEVLPSPVSLWRDVKTYGDRAYAVSEGGGGIQIFDLSQIDSGVVVQSGTVDDVPPNKTHNVAINETSGFLYRCGGSGQGLRIYSLATPDTPVFVNSWSFRYVHDAQIVTYTSGPYAGREIAFLCAGFNNGNTQTGLTILDVTDKNNILELTHFFYSTPAYSHQGWLSPDRTRFYLNDELDEQFQSTTTTTRVVNVEDLSQPVEEASFTNGNSAIDHNLYTKDDFIYAANYRSGLRIYRNNAGTLSEIAFFDTYPTDDQANFNGLWSSYPYFPSGTIIGSDLERGLFVWRFEPVSGDLNGDYIVDESDLQLASESWHQCPSNCVGDINGNLQVEVLDLTGIINQMQ